MTAPSDQPFVCPILVGRTSSLEFLLRSLDKARREKGQTVLIAGEAGVGKSRLVAEALAQAAAQDSQLLLGHCFEQDRARPYAPLLDLLHTFVAEHSPDELLSSLGPLAPELAQFLPDLVTLLPNASTPLPSTPVLEPEQLKRRLFQAFFQFFSQLTASRSLIIVVEDLHWSDETSLEFSLYLARRVASLPILLLFTYRNDEMQPSLTQFLATLDRERLATELTLARLNRLEVDEMLRAILSLQRPVRAELFDSLYDLTEGNPFFIEEVLNSLIAAGEIIHSGDAWVSEPLARLHIPRSVQAAVQRRVSPLCNAARQVLVLASVAGRRFDFALLQRLTCHDEQELLRLIKELIAAQLVVEESADRFAFRHALTRQAIYSGLLARERQGLHRAVAEIMESIYQDSLDPSAHPPQMAGAGQTTHLGDLAYHYYEAGVWEKAWHYSKRAGQQAQTLYAPRAAAEHFTRALEATRQLGQAPSLELLRARASAYETLGQFDNARADFETALQRVRARAPRDPQMELTLLLDLGLLWQGRDYSQTGKYYEDALELARTMDNPSIFAHSLNRVGNWYVNVDKPLEGLQYHRGAKDVFEKMRDRRGLAETLDLMGLASYYSADLIQGTTYYEQAIALFREFNDREGLASSLST
ncbi:MAG: AAA family ATPase [Chloroflexota bacterium]|nr:AAA family ATPase [Chloroflexota bacterium]